MKKLFIGLLMAVTLSGCGILEAGSTNDAQERRLDYLQAQISTNNSLIASLTAQINKLVAAGSSDAAKIKELQDMVKVLQAVVASQQLQLAALISAQHHRHERD